MFPGWLFDVSFVIDLACWNGTSSLSQNVVIPETVLTCEPVCEIKARKYEPKNFLNDNTFKVFPMTILQSKT